MRATISDLRIQLRTEMRRIRVALWLPESAGMARDRLRSRTQSPTIELDIAGL